MGNSAKILIVEDEALTAKALESEIQKMGYGFTQIVNCYEKVLQHIKVDIPDLILLDVNLNSEYTGIDIAYDKAILNKIPIIYLTSYTDIETQNEILKTNPKGYLSKPIKYEELKVAIAIALQQKKDIISLGFDFSYDLENQHLFKKKRPIKLSQNEKLLLEKLIDANGEFVPEEALRFSVWGYEVKSDSALRTLVSSLRKKLHPKMVENVLSFGYKLHSEQVIRS